MSVIGKNLKFTIFGESHGKCIGGVLDNIKPGLLINLEDLESFMDRRRTKGEFKSKRHESDKVIFLSGFSENKTMGTPLAFIIENKNQNSSDYDNLINTPRPSHADFVANIKYKGYADLRGGGHFSGRLTAPICVGGFFSLQELKEDYGVEIYSHLSSVGNIYDISYRDISTCDFKNLMKKDIPMADDKKIEQVKIFLQRLISQEDSIGSTVTCVVKGLKAGYGSNLFDNARAKISSYIFSIPGTCGMEFGSGFDASISKASENNDIFYYDDGQIKTKTNNCGGIQGGITNGMDIVFKIHFKAPASIGKKQKTVNLISKKNEEIVIKGRHDPCIGLRALPVVESMAGLCILDLIKSERI